MTNLTITKANASELKAGDVVSFNSTLGPGHYFDRVTLIKAGLELAVGATESPTGFDYGVTNPDGKLRRYVRDLVKHVANEPAETWEDVTDDVSVLKVGDTVRVTRRDNLTRDPGKVSEAALEPSLFGLPALSYRDNGDTWTVVNTGGSRHHTLAKVERKIAAPEPVETWEDVTDDVSVLEVGDEVRVTRSHLVSRTGEVWSGALLDGANDPMGQEGDLTIDHGNGSHYFVRARGRLHGSLAKVERKVAASELTDAQKHAADIKAIGEHMLKAAERERFCEVFDREVAELNKSLHVKLPKRPRDFVVHRVATYDVSVVATSQEEAERLADQMLRDARPNDASIAKIEPYDDLPPHPF